MPTLSQEGLNPRIIELAAKLAPEDKTFGWSVAWLAAKYSEEQELLKYLEGDEACYLGVVLFESTYGGDFDVPLYEEEQERIARLGVERAIGRKLYPYEPPQEEDIDVYTYFDTDDDEDEDADADENTD